MTEPYQPNKELLSSISIGITVIPMTFRKGFSGTGVSRRRDVHDTREVAVRLAAAVCHVHRFSGESAVSQKEVENFLFDRLTAVPDDLAKAFTAPSAGASEVARDEIAALLERALTEKWSVEYVPHTWDMTAHTKVNWKSGNSDL